MEKNKKEDIWIPEIQTEKETDDDEDGVRWLCEKPQFLLVLVSYNSIEYKRVMEKIITNCMWTTHISKRCMCKDI